jgi:hypothetical protein
VRIDDRAFQSQLGDRVFQFLRRRLRGLWRDRRQRGEAVGVRAAGGTGLLVDLAGQADGGVRVEYLQARRADHQQLHVDAIAVHRCETPRAEVAKPLREEGGRSDGSDPESDIAELAVGRDDFRNQEPLFAGDPAIRPIFGGRCIHLRHGGTGQHRCGKGALDQFSAFH